MVAILADYLLKPMISFLGSVVSIFSTGEIEAIALADYILVAIALIWLLAACITDLRKREVANWLSFSLIAIALGIRAIAAIFFQEPNYFLYGLAGLAAFFILGHLLYYTKIFAGGDAKLLIALGAVFATAPSFATFASGNSLLLDINLPFLAVFFLNILLFGSLYGIFYSIILALCNRKMFVIEVGKLSKETKKPRVIILVVILLLLVTLAFMRSYDLLLLLALILVFPYLYIFVRAVENSCMVKLTSPKQLTEGDWLAFPVKVGKHIITPKTEGLTMDEIKLIRKAKKKVWVKQGIPFVPVFLIAALASLFLGNVFVLAASLLM